MSLNIKECTGHSKENFDKNFYSEEELQLAFMQGFDLANDGIKEENLAKEWCNFKKKLNEDKFTD